LESCALSASGPHACGSDPIPMRTVTYYHLAPGTLPAGIFENPSFFKETKSIAAWGTRISVRGDGRPAGTPCFLRCASGFNYEATVQNLVFYSSHLSRRIRSSQDNCVQSLIIWIMQLTNVDSEVESGLSVKRTSSFEVRRSGSNRYAVYS
jgi:hypothetical protein